MLVSVPLRAVPRVSPACLVATHRLLPPSSSRVDVAVVPTVRQ
jgi:hypothetical protein